MNDDSSKKIKYLKEKNKFNNDLHRVSEILGMDLNTIKLNFEESTNLYAEFSKTRFPNFNAEIEFDFSEFEKIKKIMADLLQNQMYVNIPDLNSNIMIPIVKVSGLKIIDLFHSVTDFGVNFISSDLLNSIFIYQKVRDYNLLNEKKEPIGEIKICTRGLDISRELLNNKNVG